LVHVRWTVIQVNHGGTEMGQGLNTKVNQIVADELGVPMRLCWPPAMTPAAQRVGHRCIGWCTDLNARVAQFAARHVKTTWPSLSGLDGCSRAVQFASWSGAHTHKRATVQRSVSWPRRIQRCGATYFTARPKIHYDKTTPGQGGRSLLCLTARREVAIDTLTGESRVFKVDILHDVGTSINPRWT
jgi:xanthine dehydrogenase large subunit